MTENLVFKGKLVWFGLVGFGLVWLGFLCWFGLVWFGILCCSPLGRSYLAYIPNLRSIGYGMAENLAFKDNWFGLVWIGLLWFGSVFDVAFRLGGPS